MDVTLNVLYAGGMASTVKEYISSLKGVTSIDTGLANYNVLVIHTERRNVRALQNHLTAVDGILSAEVGSVGVAI